MEPNKPSLADLMQRYLNGTITEPESRELFALLKEKATDNDPGLEAALQEAYESAFEGNPVLAGETSTRILDRLMVSIEDHTEAQGTIAGEVRHIPLLRRLWLRYAAAAVVFVAAAGLAWTLINNRKKPTKEIAGIVVQTEIKAGGNHALLKLAGGREILLDSTHGNIRLEGFIASNDSGRLNYEDNAATVEYHTLSTPRGGQYQLRLPDGTEVWLNAASSITYPTAFREKDRVVKITGEAYFEVAANQEKPFKVNINDNAQVEVLGTRFNVNAYTDETSIRTSLLEGSVRVAHGVQAIMLRPGQQASISGGKLSRVQCPDPDMIIAWKNGSFQFDHTPLDDVLRQMARWYDVEVIYEKGVPGIIFSGEIKRALNLSQALIVLEKMGVHFRIAGKQLIVMP